MAKKLKLRVAQLDLARQIENLDYIKSFIDFIAKNGYNALGLYLEARIKTKSFPYPPKNESYTPEEMKRIVKYAANKGIEVIPAMATLGHMELFLKYPEMEYIAELRGGIDGRFSNQKDALCPSLDETYDFLEAYLTEITEIFPSKYMHAGCDEVWDIGICKLCKNRPEGQGRIFSKHLNKVHKIISGKLKKRMIIWDDLFENYPEELNNIPRDIIMCVWHYNQVVDTPQAHFGNRKRFDKFAIYDRFGFECLEAPRETSWSNIKTFNEYAGNYTHLGGWLTAWELSTSFLHFCYPIVAFAGKLWSGDAPTILYEKCVTETIGLKDPAFIQSVKAIQNAGVHYHLRANPEGYLRGILSEEESERNEFIKTAFEVFKSFSGKIKGQHKFDILEDLLICVELEIFYFQLRELIHKLYSPKLSERVRNSLKKGMLLDCLKKAKQLKNKRKKQWLKHRKGITPRHTDSYFDKVIAMLQDLKKIKPTGLLTVGFFLPEPNSAQSTTFYMKYKGRKTWQKISSGVYKQLPCKDAFYTYSFPVSAKGTPERIRIESRGYGGQGLAFVKIEQKNACYVPKSTTKLKGTIEHPKNILEDDDQWCFIGHKDTRSAFLNPDLAETIHSMELVLK